MSAYVWRNDQEIRKKLMDWQEKNNKIASSTNDAKLVQGWSSWCILFLFSKGIA